MLTGQHRHSDLSEIPREEGLKVNSRTVRNIFIGLVQTHFDWVNYLGQPLG